MIREILLIPKDELATGQAAAIRNLAISSTKAGIARILRCSEDELLTRDIQPSVDLGFTYATWNEVTGSTANAYETLTSGTMSDDRYVVIWGVKDVSESINVSKIKINVGGSDKAIWVLEGLYGTQEGTRIGFCPSVIVLPQNLPYTISRYVLNANSPSNIVLKGAVIEKIGKVLTP